MLAGLSGRSIIFNIEIECSDTDARIFDMEPRPHVPVRLGGRWSERELRTEVCGGDCSEGVTGRGVFSGLAALETSLDVSPA
jgi:hypothetical protein